MNPQGPQLGLARDHPEKTNSRPQPRLAGNCTHRNLGQKRRGTTPRKPIAGPSEEWQGTAPTATWARIGEGARRETNSRPQLGLVGNCTQRDLNQDWRGTTSQKPTTGVNQDRRGSAPTRTSASSGEGLAHKSQQQAPARFGGELQAQRPQPGLARDHPDETNSRPQPGWRGTAPIGASAKVGEGPPAKSQQHAPARIGGELHPHGPQPRLARDRPTKTNSAPQPRLGGNCTHRDRCQDWRGATPQKPLAGFCGVVSLQS